MNHFDFCSLLDICSSFIDSDGPGLGDFTSRQKSVLGFVLRRTLSYGKFYDVITTEDFLKGVTSSTDKRRFFPCSNHKGHLSETLKFLKSEEWLQLHSIGKNVYKVNVLKILEVGIKYLKSVGAAKFSNTCKNLYALSEVKMKEEAEMLEEKYSSDKVKELAFKICEKNKAEKKEKNSSLELRVRMIPSLIGSMCEEYHKNTIMQSKEGWTSKTYGMAKAWLRLCREGGINPKDNLSEIIRYWPYYCMKLTYPDGKPIVKDRRIFSFDAFFIDRSHAYRLIEDCKNKPERDFQPIVFQEFDKKR